VITRLFLRAETGILLTPLRRTYKIDILNARRMQQRRRIHMICGICKNEVFLAQKAEPATADDLGVAQDLLDTLIAHKGGCVGMAATASTNASSSLTTRVNTWSCLIRSLSNSPGLMRPRRAACPTPAPGRQNASGLSRCSGRIRSSRHGSRPSPAGQRRSSSTRSTTAREF